MCGPPDFGALNTCIIHLTELSVAGLATYSVCKTASVCRKLHAKRKPEERASWDQPGRLIAESARGRPNT
jgi:hypothetical protein